MHMFTIQVFCLSQFLIFFTAGNFLVDKVAPQANGDSSKVKVKVRVNIHGIFLVSSASMVEKLEPGEEDKEEPMEVDNGPVAKKDQKEAENTASNEEQKGKETTTPPEEGKENAAAGEENKGEGEVGWRTAC